MAAAEKAINPSAPYDGAAAITPHDSNASISGRPRGIYVGGAGAVKVDMEDGTTATFAAVPVGTFMPIKAVKVYATGTTATNLLALY